MRELRMPKGWVLFGTNALEFGNTETKAEKVRRMRKFDNAIRNTKKLSYEDLEKVSKESYEKHLANNAALLKAYEEKKLKSKTLIKKAKALKKAKAEAAAKKKKQAEPEMVTA